MDVRSSYISIENGRFFVPDEYAEALAYVQARARREALEEAIDCCAQYRRDDGTAQKIEAAIRALISDVPSHAQAHIP